MKKKRLFFLILSLSLLLSGCWSKRELNELSIVSALGIDKVDDHYEVSVQIVDTSQLSSKQASSIRTPIVTYSAQGDSVFEAIRRMTARTPRKLYIGHMQIVVIGEELAKQGISDSLDFLARDHESRNNFLMVVSHNANAKEILSIITHLEKIPTNKMRTSLEVSEKAWASTSVISLDDLISNLKSSESTVLSTITIRGDLELGMENANIETTISPALLLYVGLSVFKEGKLVGILDEEESKGYNYVKGNVKSTIEVISCPNGGNLSTELIDAPSKVKGIVKNGVPSIEVTVEVTQNIGEVECNIDLSKIESIDLVNKKTSKHIKEKIKRSLNTIQQEYKADVLGFGDAIHRADYKAWNKLKDNWDEQFPDLKVNVTVNVKTRGLGLLQNSMTNNSKE